MASRSGDPLVETLAAFAVVFALQFVAQLVGLMGFLFVLSPPLEVNPWTLVTSVYAHQTVGHLLSNALALVVVGWPVARATTRLRFHAFFVATGALAGVAQLLLSAWLVAATQAVPGGWLAAVPFVPAAPTTGVLGASGAVFALMGYLLAGNRLSTRLVGRLTLPSWAWFVLVVGLAAVVTMATAAPGVALIAHATGFVLGLVAGRLGLLRPGSQSVANRSRS